MTQLAPVQNERTVLLGRRIGEIMEEKGDAYSLRAFGRRIGMSKDVLHRCLMGDRYIKPSELEKIAAGLGLSVSRLKQGDTEKEREELCRLLKNVSNVNRSLELALLLEGVALGVSERCEALKNLGTAYFIKGMYDQAHNAWTAAYSYAVQVVEKYRDSELLIDISANLLLSLTTRKEYSNRLEIQSRVLPLLDSHPKRSGQICYSLAEIAESLRNFQEARSY